MGSTYEPEIVAISVEVGPRGVLHLAVFRGERYFPRVQDIHTTTDQVTVLKIVTDGFCTHDSLIRGRRGADSHTNVHKAEMNILKRSMMEECARRIASSVQGGERTITVKYESVRLTVEQSASLILMGVTIRAQARGEHASIASLHGQLRAFSDSNQWILIPHMAFAAEVLQSNISYGSQPTTEEYCARITCQRCRLLHWPVPFTWGSSVHP